MTYTRTQRNGKRGFTLLLAALVSSIALAVGISIFSIVNKQIQLSSMGRDSQFAFYAADGAADCALFWDVRRQVFSTTTPPAPPPDPNAVTCATQSVAVTTTDRTDVSGAWQSTDFSYSYDEPGTPSTHCVNVVVTKAAGASAGTVNTTVHVDGFNTTCAEIATSPRALQRSVELNY